MSDDKRYTRDRSMALNRYLGYPATAITMTEYEQRIREDERSKIEQECMDDNLALVRTDYLDELKSDSEQLATAQSRIKTMALDYANCGDDYQWGFEQGVRFNERIVKELKDKLATAQAELADVLAELNDLKEQILDASLERKFYDE